VFAFFCESASRSKWFVFRKLDLNGETEGVCCFSTQLSLNIAQKIISKRTHNSHPPILFASFQ
jgi:hypothetical protein